ncbi:MAG: Zn-dependent exopeptidase M28 [Roseivirga sp.]|nr:Zn-dependent exopeptidase M28 [Roseivirga sp.]
MRFLSLLMLLVFTQACAQNTKDPVPFEALWKKDASQYGLDKDFLDRSEQGQRALISALTGASPIQDSKSIQRRWTTEERALSRQYLSKELEKMGLNTIELPYEMNLPQLNKQQNPAKGTNLYAVVESTNGSNEYIVLGAHYDTVEEAPGASDNASGCALVYAVAKAMMQQKQRSKNLMIVFFDKEEIGHAGATAFAQFLLEQQYNIHSVHTADQVGWDQDGDRNIELELPGPELKAVYRKHAKTFDIKAYRTNETGSDHKELRAAGFNAVGITEEYRRGDTSPYHHDPEDKFETINFDYLSFVSYFVFKVLVGLMETN